MADNIVESLFGPSPWQIQQQQNANLNNSALQYAQLDQFQRANMSMFNAGGSLAGLVAPALGMVNPQMQEAQKSQDIQGQIDHSTPDGLLKGAALFQQAGSPRMAATYVQAANAQKMQEAKSLADSAKATLDFAQAQKELRENPNLTVTEIGVTGKPGMLQKVLYDKTDPSGKTTPIGSPYLSPSGARITVSNAAAGSSLSPEAIDAAAASYRLTGVLPALGMGGIGVRTAILNRAAQLASADGSNAQAEAINKIANKSNQVALSQLEKQATMVGAFEKTAKDNANLALSLSDKVDRTGIPVFDKWVQAGQKSVAGNSDVASFHAANETFINEYAKIMSGSMGNNPVSDAARANAHEILSHAYTKEQYKQVINTLKTEMNNRISGFNQQRAELKAAISNKGQAPAVNPPTTSSPTGSVKFLGFE